MSSRSLDSSRAREEAVINSIHDEGRIDHAASEVATVEALNGVLSALHLLELEVNFALGVLVGGDVHNAAILGLALRFDIVLEFLYPVFAGFPISNNKIQRRVDGKKLSELHLLFRVEHVSQDNASACRVGTDGQCIRFVTRLYHLRMVSAGRGFICTREFSHQRVSTVVVEVHPCHVRIIQCTPSAISVVAAACPIEGGHGASAASPREGGALEVRAVMPAVSAWARSLVTQANSDRAAGKLEVVHLLHGLSSIVSFLVPIRYG